MTSNSFCGSLKTRITTGAAVMFLSACGAYRYTAGFNPTVTVDVEHAPSIGFVVEEVVFAPAEAPSRSLGSVFSGIGPATCQAEFVQMLTEMLIQGGLRVTSYDTRQNADAMIAVNVTQCQAEQYRTEETQEVTESLGDNTRRRDVVTKHARTKVLFRALFTVTDLSTDQVAVSRTLTSEPERFRSSTREEPDFPPVTDVLADAYSAAARTARPMLLHWTERRDLVFFDDERCGLDVAFRALEAGYRERALELSIANADFCIPDIEGDIGFMDVAAANYNVGVLHRIGGDFESALESLERARAADPSNEIISATIAETLSAQAAADEIVRARDDAEARAEQLNEEAQESAARILTNDEIVGMFRDGLPDQVIIQVIEASEVDFDVTPAALRKLNRAGLSAALISAMVRAAGRDEAGVAVSWRLGA